MNINKKIFYVSNTNTNTNIDSNNYIKSTFNEFKEWLKNQQVIGLDTETEGLFNHNNKIVMLQVSNSNECWVLDVRNTKWISDLKSILEDIIIIGHNLKFDYKFLKKEDIILKNIYDTFLAECVLTNGKEDRQLGLAYVCLKYTNNILNKDTRNQFVSLDGNVFTDTQILYGANDVAYLFEIRAKQLEEAYKLNLIEVINLENSASLALADIEYNGIKLNKDKWLLLAENLINKLPLYEKELDNMVYELPELNKFVKKEIQGNLFADIIEGFEHDRKVKIKWSSPLQLFRVFTSLGLDIKTTSEKEIGKYQNKYPLVKKFIDYKKDSKLVTTYGKNFIKFINKYTNRIHADFWQILDTHRVSCGGSKTNGKSSVNLQNLPAKNEYLNCFEAEEGWKIVGIDYAAQEARLAACGSQDELWLNTFKEGKDLHSEVCKLMFNITDDLVKTKPDFLRGKTYRDAAKTINFGVLFGMSEFKLSSQLNITVEEAKDLIKKYFEATKQLKGYLDSCANYGLTNGYIRSFKPYSCIRYFPEWKKDLDSWKDKKIIGNITRASYNTPIQATGALMTKLALIKIREYILINNLNDKVKLIHVVHDAIYTECIKEYTLEWSKIQAKLMENTGKDFNLELPMLTDITIDDKWTK